MLPAWLLRKLSNARDEEITKICVVLWGVWVWKNKRIWEGKAVTAALAMTHSLNHVADCKMSRLKNKEWVQNYQQQAKIHVHKWKPPEPGVLKAKLMHHFILSLQALRWAWFFKITITIFWQEEIYVWNLQQSFSELKLMEQGNSLLDQVEAATQSESWAQKRINACCARHQEQLRKFSRSGGRIDQCKMLLEELANTSVHFVKNQANRIAHEFVRLPCLVNYHNEFSSLPSCVVEAILSDYSF